jgi:hypothetical protein
MSVKPIPATEYVDRILADRDNISSSELEVEGDFDFVMLMMVALDYDVEASPYLLEFSQGQTRIGRYYIPNMRISRR